MFATLTVIFGISTVPVGAVAVCLGLSYPFRRFSSLERQQEEWKKVKMLLWIGACMTAATTVFALLDHFLN